ncbi:MAG: gliding motility-associated-like protein [Limisphaerales bacterium]
MKYSFVFLLILTQAFSSEKVGAQCVSAVDFNSWTQEGDPSTGNWVISGGGAVVEQTLNELPSFFVGQDTLINVEISGQISVNTTDDDDFVGFVFGYNEPSSYPDSFQFYLFDWKKITQIITTVGCTGVYAGNEGFTLSKLDAKLNSSCDYQRLFWDHEEGADLEVLDSLYNSTLGWVPFTTHEFKLSYLSNQIIVLIDGDTIFNYSGCFEPGRFGFYNFSQANVNYSNFQYKILGTPSMPEYTCGPENITVEFGNEGCGSVNSSIIDSLTWILDGIRYSTTSSTYNLSLINYGWNTIGLEVLDINGCISYFEDSVRVLETPFDTIKANICIGDSYLFNGIFLGLQGIYNDTLITALGCDSIIVLDLKVHPVYSDTVAYTLCEGDSAFIIGDWIYSDTLILESLLSIMSCDSLIFHELNFLENSNVSQNVWLCGTGTISVGPSVYSAPGTYIDTLIKSNGCDSVVLTNIFPAVLIGDTSTIEYCIGDSVFNGFSWFSTDGIFQDTVTGVSGCDSIIWTSVAIIPVEIDAIDLRICDGDSMLINGVWEIAAGIYPENYITADGCQATRFIDLSFELAAQGSQAITLCTLNDSVLINGIWINSSGIFYEEYISNFGCDSLVEITVSEFELNTDTVYVALCGNQEYEGNSIGSDTILVSYSIDLNGCTEVLVTLIELTESECCNATVPNAFTPNLDGLNDVFQPILHSPVAELEFMVFNRWGKMVYSSDDPALGWDGSFKGKAAEMGSYIWSMRCVNTRGDISSSQGTVTLLR